MIMHSTNLTEEHSSQIVDGARTIYRRLWGTVNTMSPMGQPLTMLQNVLSLTSRVPLSLSKSTEGEWGRGARGTAPGRGTLPECRRLGEGLLEPTLGHHHVTTGMDTTHSCASRAAQPGYVYASEPRDDFF